jgi:hypothetical protein
MKRSFYSMLIVAWCVGFTAIPGARGQAFVDPNAPLAGPLAGVAEATAKVGFKDKIPAKLCALLWPALGTNQDNCIVRKVAIAGKEPHELKYLIVRLDNRDVVMARVTASEPKDDMKLREERYYLTTAQGDLALALEVTFEFKVNDVDSDVLKNVTWQAYGQTPGGETLPVTPEVKEQFETEKKFWLKQEKSLKKQARKLSD